MGHERGLPGTNDACPDNALCVRRPASGWVGGYVQYLHVLMTASVCQRQRRHYLWVLARGPVRQSLVTVIRMRRTCSHDLLSS